MTPRYGDLYEWHGGGREGLDITVIAYIAAVSDKGGVATGVIVQSIAAAVVGWRRGQVVLFRPDGGLWDRIEEED